MEDSAKSPTKAPQRRGACGHIMAAFDQHQRCARCRENKKGQDLCVRGEPCNLCEALTPEQQRQLATPKYRDRKEKKAAAASVMEVDPTTVTIIGPPTQEDRASLSADKGKGKKSTSTTTPVKGREPGPGSTSAVLITSPAPDRTAPDLPLRRDIGVSQMDLTAMAMAIREELSKKDQEREEERFRREQAREEAWAERFARLEAKMVSATFNQPSSSVSRPEPVQKRPEPAQDPEDSPQEAEIEITAQESDIEASDTSPDSDDQAADSRPPTSSFQSQSGLPTLPSQSTGSESEELSYRETMSALRHTLGLKIPDKEGSCPVQEYAMAGYRSLPPVREVSSAFAR